MKALILNGEVVQLESVTFPVHGSLTWIDIPQNQVVNVKDTYSGGKFNSPPSPSLASQWASLRAQRDQRLKACDWRFLSDMMPTPAWVSYRQALRNFPAKTADPQNPNWPIPPAQ